MALEQADPAHGEDPPRRPAIHRQETVQTLRRDPEPGEGQMRRKGTVFNGKVPDLKLLFQRLGQGRDPLGAPRGRGTRMF